MSKKQYIVLYAISLDQGGHALPASEGEPPTIIDEDALFWKDSEFFSRDERERILINKGVIVPVDEPDRVEVARTKLKQTDAEAAKSLQRIT